MPVASGVRAQGNAAAVCDICRYRDPDVMISSRSASRLHTHKSGCAKEGRAAVVRLWVISVAEGKGCAILGVSDCIIMGLSARVRVPMGAIMSSMEGHVAYACASPFHSFVITWICTRFL